MATAFSTSNQEDLFTCPICLDLLKVPVTVHCGHSYCMDCINNFWNEEDAKKVYSCPQCRQKFAPRPMLRKNNVFSELVEQMKKTKIEDSTPVDDGCLGPEDVKCDVCTERKVKAVKSCLDCLASYCEAHFKAHNEFPPLRKHSVIAATHKLQERICSQHSKALDIFCRTDQTFICCVCMMDKHKKHDTISTAAEWTKSQKDLVGTRRTCKQKIKERENELHNLNDAVKNLKISVQTAVEEIEEICAKMISSVEEKSSDLIDMIRVQEKAELSPTVGLQEKLEDEIAELKRRDAELEQLSHTKDHIHFLKSFKEIKVLTQFIDIPNVNFSQEKYSKILINHVTSLKVELDREIELMLKQKIATSVPFEGGRVLLQPVTARNTREVLDFFCRPSDAPPEPIFTKPVTRKGFLRYYCHFNLDLNTTYRLLQLSECNRKVSLTPYNQSYPDHVDRFDRVEQVLCRQGVSKAERCYWEVDTCDTEVGVAVSYESIRRRGKGSDCRFGCNAQSWRLDQFSSSNSFWHNNKETKLALDACSTIGVYVDYDAGELAFYSVCASMTLLHRVKTKFTQTLYPGFMFFGANSSVKLI